MKSIFEFVANVAKYVSSNNVSEASSIEATKVYTFDVVSGNVKEKVFNLSFPHVNKSSFQTEFIHAWYNREEAKVTRDANKFADDVETYKAGDDETITKITKEETEALENALEIVRANEKAICSEFASLKAVQLNTVPFTVRVFVNAVRREKASDDVLSYFESTFNALKSIQGKVTKDKIPCNADIKAIKEALFPVTSNLWQEHKNVIEKYTFNVNSRLAIEVWQILYKGIRVTNKGTLKREYAKNVDIVREVVFQMFLQLNEKEATAQTTKEVKEKDAELASAMCIK